MSSSIPGSRPLPSSRYDLSTYWGRVRHSMDLSDPSTLFVSSTGLSQAKDLIFQYKSGAKKEMNPDLWRAKKIIDSTLHPDTGQPVFLPFRMSCFVLSNLIVTAGMLQPGLKTAGILGWQITNQSLNVAINASNANKSSPLSYSGLAQSYAMAVTASCSVALGLNALVPRLKRVSPAVKATLGRLVPFAAVASAGALNVFLMRAEEMRQGIDVYPASSSSSGEEGGDTPKSLGKSKAAARIAVTETALSRVFNSTPIMVLPPLILARLQQQAWLKSRPRLVLPANLGLILTTSIFALPLALAVFPQREKVKAGRLEKEFWVAAGGEAVDVEFNRGV
ncbi:hypothetical protein FH972_025646 [Carpinus fangiana]|uniref:Sidoreflexin n=1 Tax=Carpinus fangiana TaxID=176857 RepID=A0A5N6L1L7_9ROSI|nr:hypothetical protein FH972_025646 [Carpinus fangiana]